MILVFVSCFYGCLIGLVGILIMFLEGSFMQFCEVSGNFSITNESFSQGLRTRGISRQMLP